MPTYTPLPTLTPRPSSTPTVARATTTFTPNPSTLVTPPALPIGGSRWPTVAVNLLLAFGVGFATVGLAYYLRVRKK
jgi:hypothetical protein